MDIGNLASIDDAVVMELIHPKTHAPFKNDAGDMMTISIRSRTSEEVRFVTDKQRDRALKDVARGKRTINAEEIEANAVDILVAATAGWTIDNFGGQPFPFNPDNARKLYSTPNLRWIRDQVDQHMGDEGNFIKG